MEIRETKSLNEVQIPQVTRSDGFHVTQLIHGIDEKLKLSSFHGKEPIHEFQYVIKVGFMWEEVLSYFWSDLGCRIGEVEKDDIYGSPDGVIFRNDDDLVVQEYKATWMSSKKTPDLVWRWMCQTKAYCYMLDSHIAEFHVLYLNGDYSFKEKYPQYKVFEVTYTDEELLENWNMLVNYKRSIEK